MFFNKWITFRTVLRIMTKEQIRKELIQKIEDHGREVYEILLKRHCKDGTPIMIPPAPESKHYDIFNIDKHDDILQDSGEQSTTLRQQLEWEAEISVYREFERMTDQDLVVIHSFSRSTTIHDLFQSTINSNVNG